jgi:DNA-binding NarL/FixJ family response regulator
MLRQGVRYSLERESDFEVIGEASDGEEAVRLVDELKPNVVVMDIGMPLVDGLEATRRIKEEHPDITVLVLTIHDDEEYVLGLFEAGASGYLLKGAYGEDLAQAIRSVRCGELVVYPLVFQKLLKRAANRKSKPIKLESAEHLTPRELEVLRHAATGMKNQDIATELGIGIRTVKGHMISILSKLRVGSRVEAVLCAFKLGLVSPEDIVWEYEDGTRMVMSSRKNQ